MFKDSSGKVPVETFADFMSAGYSAVDFFTGPSWEKAGYLVWDTFSVFIPYIPGSYSAKGFNYVTRITEESINDVSECIAKNASKIESAINNITDEIVKSQSTKILNNSIKTYARNLAKKYNLTEKVFKNHIIAKHGVRSKVEDASKFIDGVDVKYAIDTALKNPNSKVLKNTDNRKGYIFKYTFDYAIGKDKDGNKVNTIKVVLGENANVITAYPVK